MLCMFVCLLCLCVCYVCVFVCLLCLDCAYNYEGLQTECVRSEHCCFLFSVRTGTCIQQKGE